MRIQNIAEMQKIIDDPKSPYEILTAELAEQKGIVFGIGQKYNISLCKLMVIVDRTTNEIAGYVYKKLYCQSRWCSQWDKYEKAI